MSIAATGALQFNAKELDQLNRLQDVHNPVYRSVVERLSEIRKMNTAIIYAYLIRPKSDTTVFEFIADADGIEPLKASDVNNDGQINSQDDVGWPGRQYDITHIDVLKNGVYQSPNATDAIYTDQWGSALTGYAPIRDQKGEIKALLAIDIDTSQIDIISRKTFSPAIVFRLMTS
jgi:methyl-accepting chemotaxis protein